MAYLRYSSAMALSAFLMMSTLLASTGPQSAFGQTGSLKVTVVHTDGSPADPDEFFPIVGPSSGFYSLYDDSGVPVAEFSTLVSCNSNPGGCTVAGLEPGNYEARIMLPHVPAKVFSQAFTISVDQLTQTQIVADYGQGRVTVLHQDGSLADYLDFYGNSFSQGWADIYDSSDQLVSNLATCNHPNSVGNNVVTTFCPAAMPSGDYVAEVAIRGIGANGAPLALATFSGQFAVTDNALTEATVTADYGFAKVTVVHSDGSLAVDSEFYAPVPNAPLVQGVYSLYDSSGFRSEMSACSMQTPDNCENPIPSGTWEARIVRASDSEEILCWFQMADLAQVDVQLNIDDGSCAAEVLPNFDVAISPSERIVALTGQTTFQVSVQPIDGFDFPVSLAISCDQQVIACTFVPSVILPGETSILTIEAFTQTPLGLATFDVRATSEDVEHARQIKLHVTKVVGVQNDVILTKYQVKTSGDCQFARTKACFSIQQNIPINLVTDTGSTYTYFAQNIIFVRSLSGKTQVASSFQIFSPASSTPDCFPPPNLINQCELTPWMNVRLPNHFVLSFLIDDGELTVYNEFLEYSYPVGDGAYINQANDPPELAVVGFGDRANAQFGRNTLGQVYSSVNMEGIGWSDEIAESIRTLNDDRQTDETSINLGWTEASGGAIFGFSRGASDQAVIYVYEDS